MTKFNADKLRQLMKAQRVTGRALADRVGVTNVTISRILNARQQPSRKLAGRLAREFEMSVEEFYREGPPIRPGGFDGRALAAHRRARGWSRPDLAARIDLDLSTVADWEMGRSIPDGSDIAALADVLEVSDSALKWRPAGDFDGGRLRRIRERRGVLPDAFAGAVGIEPERLLLWEAGEEPPSEGELRRMAQILGVDDEQLRRCESPEAASGAADGGPVPPRAETIDQIARALSALSPSRCLQVLAYIQGLIANEPSVPSVSATAGRRSAPAGRAADVGSPSHPGYRLVSQHEIAVDHDWRPTHVPVIDRIAAGVGSDTDEAEAFPPGWAECFLEFAGAPDGAFAVRVTGDSMAPRYRDGDMLVVDPSRPGRPGEVCVVLYHDPSTGVRMGRLKRLRLRGGRIVLESLNARYAPVELPAEQIEKTFAVHAHLPKAGRADRG